MTHYRSIIISLLTLLCLTANARETDNGYRIDSWLYEATVHADDSWDVTETMTVTFLEERHGIYRYIPRSFSNSHPFEGRMQPFSYNTDIDDVNVSDYYFETYDNDDSQDNLVIRIGNADELVSGQHRYVIHYRLTYPDDRYEGCDEIFHTVLGTDCNTTIGKFSYDIRFDKSLPSSTKHKIYSGTWGDKGNTLNVSPQYSATGISGTVSDIAPFEGITIHSVMPEGYWESPRKVSATTNYVWLYVTLILMLLTLAKLLLNRRETPLKVIEYSAPDGMSSAEVGVIIDDIVDISDLSSLIVWFASKGYLKIREVDKQGNLELIKMRLLPDDAPEYQHKFMQVLFKRGSGKVLLSKLGDRHKEMSAAWRALQKEFRGERKLTTANRQTCTLFTLSVIAGICFFATSSSVTKLSGEMVAYSLVLWSMPIAIVTLLRILASNYDMIISRLWKIVQFVAITLTAGVSLFLLWVLHEAPDSLQPFSVLATIATLGWLMALLSGRLMKDTEYRREKMSLLLGFREFIDKAEMPMLKAQVDENPSYFFDVLPFAMVFGLTKKWQEQFANITMETPEWYQVHSSASTLSTHALMSRMTTSMSKSVTKAIEVSSHDTTAQHSSSSSSSFSGFSGGGGGGGGVGSW